MPWPSRVILLLVVLAAGMAVWFASDLPSPDDLSTAATAPVARSTTEVGGCSMRCPHPILALDHTPVPLKEI